MKCPICGSTNVTKLKTGSYRCNDCGFVFYPTREVIIDMRDLLTGDELTEEEINELGEKIKEQTENVSEKIFGKSAKNVFRALSSLDEILAQYNEDDRVFGIFADFSGSVKGTVMIMVQENEIDIIKKIYRKKEVIEALKQLGKETAEGFKEIFQDDLFLEGVDIAYDTIPSIINYLISEIAGERNMILNVKMIVDKAPKGEIIFVPQKDSIKYLKSVLGN
ncbi:hypothetical protein [Candidatus Aciduliprofundum boonei]|uniref:Zinc finger TFIIB-type domain protein n=1 Tax=Aciduliprofundum boonei (strain DSM 19572 / T469) TaxID=439481 RepID=B5IFB2_ACIB4|nr:hypothetical protein [Candidatus Aciduliprofundum boonei]ADD07861.1 Zinc finger TFIIB-type domain protein [Aciduliprofundum boonei T469]EDY35021.1 hypothetical protein ABOONEI_1307 [Aciduliprofundum boonei T469]HII54966.1 hypothetical protein [Candidatus Aciduliprofundum boonei]